MPEMLVKTALLLPPANLLPKFSDGAGFVFWYLFVPIHLRLFNRKACIDIGDMIGYSGLPLLRDSSQREPTGLAKGMGKF